MALTAAQLSTLKAAILADPALNAEPNNSDGAFAIAAALNQLSSPAFIVWKTDIPTKDIKKVINWPEYISRNLREPAAL